MKIAIAQINPIVGDFKNNARKITEHADRAKALGCGLIVFSELVISGYPPRDLLEKEDFITANRTCLEQLTASITGIGVICGVVEKNTSDQGNSLYNSAILFEDGKTLHRIHKRLLPNYDIFDERRYFEPGAHCTVYPYGGRRIGLTVCEDLWNDKDIFKRRMYALDPAALMAQEGADLIINISASPFHAGKQAFRSRMIQSIAAKYRIPLIFANQVGGNDSILFDGLSAAYDQTGKLVARARDFEEDLVMLNLSDPGALQPATGDIHPVSGSDAEATLKALIMGTRDYVRKCGFSQVIIGVSGGIDSALTACIAAKALGNENVMAVFMPSRYTSAENHEDTKRLAENLGVALSVIPIDGMFQAFLKHLMPSFKENEPGIMEQNLQARIRGTILMALSNRLGSLVLSTGNKSELAVGYCTLYGDMNGGLAVISDVPKTAVYELSRLVNAEKATIPQRVIDKAPSAELKPDQTDQDDLPPYETLDPLLKGYIEEFKGPEELVAMGFDRALVADVIARVDRNEYKRHQAAPGLKVTSKAFGYGRRYPLAQRYKPDS